MFMFLSRFGRLIVGTAVVIAVTSVLGFNTLTTNAVPVASHHSSHGGSTGTSSLSLVLLNPTDGSPHYGQVVTFNVSTTATSYPSVDLKCYQNGAMVMAWTAGFYPGYLWTKNVTLSSPSWTGGAANCTATLIYSNSKTVITLATLSFQVYA